MREVGRRLLLGTGAVLVAVGAVLLVAAALPVGGHDVARSDEAGLDPATALAPVHEAGVTGANVSVGVVDVTGFDVDRAPLRERVAATRAFGSRESVADGGRTGHGTAAASTVAEAAPGADLYLATFDAAPGYRRALNWLVERDVDVVVAPVTFYGKPDDGSGAVADATTRAVRNGTTVVAPAGNVARGHWSGRYDDVEGDALSYGPGTQNYVDGDAGTFTLWLSWDRDHRTENYTAELYRTNGSDDALVARSEPYGGDDAPNARIVADLDPGRHYLVVRGPANATGARLTLESPTHRFHYRTPRGSVAPPATAPGVLAVGAFDRRADGVAGFSSRGPTADGRVGVDVVAPHRFRVAGRSDPFVGSSAAAAYVGGIAALSGQHRPEATPRRVERRLERTAADVGRPGVDPAAGHGTVRPHRPFSGADGPDDAPRVRAPVSGSVARSTAADLRVRSPGVDSSVRSPTSGTGGAGRLGGP